MSERLANHATPRRRAPDARPCRASLVRPDGSASPPPDGFANPRHTSGMGIQTLDALDRRVTGALARVAVPTTRVALGIVFLWFGALKF